MKQLVFTIIGFVSITGGANAFKPSNKDTLQAAVNACVDPSVSPVGDCCASPDGSISNANGQSCPENTKHLSDWDTSLVTDFSYLFDGRQSFDQDVGKWDTSSVTKLQQTFRYARSFTNKGKPLLWDTSSVTSLRQTFAVSKFNKCLCNWDTSKFRDMSGAFDHAQEFNQDLSCWDISNVDNVNKVFHQATAMDQTLNWDLSHILSHKKSKWNTGANIVLDTSHNPTPCEAVPTCNSFTCEDPKEKPRCGVARRK